MIIIVKMQELLRQEPSDSQTSVILEMEKKLNPFVFWRRMWKTDRFCTLSSNQYWDWLTYIDVRFSSHRLGRLPE